MECRFLKPVYDGRLALVKAADAQAALEVTVESEGVLCATARALLDASAAVVPSIDSYAHRPPSTVLRPMRRAWQRERRSA